MSRKKTRIPDILEKRELLYGDETDPAELSGCGDAFFEDQYYHDAFLFYQKAGNTEKLEKLREKALELANLNVLARIDRIEGMNISPENWKKAAEKALVEERLRDAAEMFERAGDSEKASEIRQAWAPEGDADEDDKEEKEST